jgi:hypothetical protein
MGDFYRFEMELDVFDESALRRAAKDRALESGLGTADAARFVGAASVEDCLVMVLDPAGGTQPFGVQVERSRAEEVCLAAPSAVEWPPYAFRGGADSAPQGQEKGPPGAVRPAADTTQPQAAPCVLRAFPSDSADGWAARCGELLALLPERVRMGAAVGILEDYHTWAGRRRRAGTRRWRVELSIRGTVLGHQTLEVTAKTAEEAVALAVAMASPHDAWVPSGELRVVCWDERSIRAGAVEPADPPIEEEVT